MKHRIARAQRQGKLSGPRNAARGRLDRRESAVVRGNTDTASSIGAEAERRTACGNDRGLATGAAARRAREIVRIIGPTINEIVTLGRGRKLRHISLAKDDAAGCAQPGDCGAVGLRDEARPALGAAGADDACGFQGILYGNGDAVKRTFDVAACERRVGFIGFFPRRLCRQLDDGIEFRIDLGDPLQMRLYDIFRAQFLGSNSFGELAGRRGGDGVIRLSGGLRRTDERPLPHCRRCCANHRDRAQKFSPSHFVAHLRSDLFGFDGGAEA